jgi:hypothetical protein
MWVYEQDSGDLYHRATGKKPEFVGTGYSGAGKTRSQGRNNSHLQHVKGVGPIPQGDWAIGKPRTSKRVGPVAMDLKPLPATDTFGRTAFMIHGDNKASNASRGCIILARPIREMIAKSGDPLLMVVRDTDDHPGLLS